MSFVRQRSMSWNCFDDHLAVNFSDSVSETADNKISSKKVSIEEEIKQAFSSKYVMKTDSTKMTGQERRARYFKTSCNSKNHSLQKMMEVISESSFKKLSSSSSPSVSKDSDSSDEIPSVLTIVKREQNK